MNVCEFCRCVLSEKLNELKCPNCGAPISIDNKENNQPEGELNNNENATTGDLLKYLKERDKEREKKEEEKRIKEESKNVFDWITGRRNT
jgi:uncharacterized Zn finger protein (UPF0148 family)